MIRDIVKDQLFLQFPSAAASADDYPIAKDLLDTLKFHADHCVGLAAT